MGEPSKGAAFGPGGSAGPGKEMDPTRLPEPRPGVEPCAVPHGSPLAPGERERMKREPRERPGGANAQEDPSV